MASARSLGYPDGMADVTQILEELEQGDPTAPERLLPLVYDELRQLAAARMAQESPDHTLQPTALVHEVYLRLLDSDQIRSWSSRGHFFAAAALAMRRILIDSARAKKRRKRGGDFSQVPLFDVPNDTVFGSPDRLLELDDALTRFELVDPEVAELVHLRLYAGPFSARSGDGVGHLEDNGLRAMEVCSLLV